jgi:hypothetical protein
MQNALQKIWELKKGLRAKHVDQTQKQFETIFKDISEGRYDEKIVKHIEKNGISSYMWIAMDLESGAQVPVDLKQDRRISSKKTIANEYVVELWVGSDGKPVVLVDLDDNSHRNRDYFCCKWFMYYITLGFLRAS